MLKSFAVAASLLIPASLYAAGNSAALYVVNMTSGLLDIPNQSDCYIITPGSANQPISSAVYAVYSNLSSGQRGSVPIADLNPGQSFECTYGNLFGTQSINFVFNYHGPYSSNTCKTLSASGYVSSCGGPINGNQYNVQIYPS